MTAHTDPAALFEMPKESIGGLADRFGIPPLTVFDRRLGYWQDRRRRWLDMGINSGDGREGGLAFVGRTDATDFLSAKILGVSGGTSVFDPVIAETMVRWYSPAGGLVFDPFAGGSVRGLVSHALGRRYLGCDIRPEQLDANYAQLGTFHHNADIAGTNPPRWILQDGTTPFPIDDTNPPADMILTCPPYGDLEVYSDRPEDLSTMGFDEFADAYTDAITHAVDRLADNRFSVWVVGNYRDSRTGHLRDLVGLTIAAHTDAGLGYHAEAIVVDPVGTGAMRAAATFAAVRRPIRTHQQVLVFVKGNAKEAANACEPFDDRQLEQMFAG